MVFNITTLLYWWVYVISLCKAYIMSLCEILGIATGEQNNMDAGLFFWPKLSEWDT